MSQIWDIYCKHCLWSIFGPCSCTKSCKTTLYAHLSRIWKLTWFTRFIRKVFTTKILLSGKFLLFLTLYVTWSCVYSIFVIFFFKFQYLLKNKNFPEWRPGAGKIQRYSLCLVCESDIGDLRWQTRPQICVRTYFASNISKEIFVNQVASVFCWYYNN